MRKLFKNAAADIPASVVVFLVALPFAWVLHSVQVHHYFPVLLLVWSEEL